MFLLGLNLPHEKHVLFAIRAFREIGPKVAKRICDQSSIHKLCRVRDLTESHVTKMKPLIQEVLDTANRKKLLHMRLHSMRENAAVL